MRKIYTTNYFRSVLFYASILVPLVVILITIPMVKDLKNSWPAIVIFYPLFFLLEFLFIRYMKTVVTIDDEGMCLRNHNLSYEAQWSEVVQLREYLFGQGELFYELLTKDNKKISFSSSIEDCSDLLKEIEEHTKLKFKQRI